MIRTQISLEASELSWLRHEAKVKGLSVAAVVRELIHFFEMQYKQVSKQRAARSALKKSAVRSKHPWVGVCKDAGFTDARQVNDYLYGKEA